MCCQGEPLQPIIDELAATRVAPEGETGKGLELRHGPAFTINPLTGRKDLPAWPQMRQVFVNGMRIGYVNLKPGGKISLLRAWEPAQLEVIRAAILEAMALEGHDLQKPRKLWAPKYDGMLSPEPAEETTSDSPIILPA